MFRWDCVPRFRGTEVKIVDRVQIHVLGMPCKSCFPHAKVQVGCIDAIDRDTIVLIDEIEDGSKPVDVPYLDNKEKIILEMCVTKKCEF